MAAAVDGSRFRIEARSAAGLTEAWLGAVHWEGRNVHMGGCSDEAWEEGQVGGHRTDVRPDNYAWVEEEGQMEDHSQEVPPVEGHTKARTQVG